MPLIVKLPVVALKLTALVLDMNPVVLPTPEIVSPLAPVTVRLPLVADSVPELVRDPLFIVSTPLVAEIVPELFRLLGLIVRPPTADSVPVLVKAAEPTVNVPCPVNEPLSCSPLVTLNTATELPPSNCAVPATIAVPVPVMATGVELVALAMLNDTLTGIFNAVIPPDATFCGAIRRLPPVAAPELFVCK